MTHSTPEIIQNKLLAISKGITNLVKSRVVIDELTVMASEHSSSGPALHEMTPATISSGLVPNPPPSQPFVPPSRTDWDILFQLMFDELLTPPPSIDLLAPEVIALIDEVPAPICDQDNPNHEYKQKQALYGLKQALRTWQGITSGTIYVDDIIFAASTPELCDLFAKIIGIFINQSKYALESLKKYGFDSCDPVDTPMVEKSKLDEDKEGKAVDPSHYRGMIGTLLYLTASRPDLQFAIYADQAGLSRIRSITILEIMSIIKEQQQALDDALVPREQRLTIGSCNYRFKHLHSRPKEPTFNCLEVSLTHHPSESSLLDYCKSKTKQEPKPSPGKRVKATAKVAKSGKKKQPTLGLETLLEVTLTKVEQLKLATKRSLIQTHISHVSGSGAHKRIGVSPGVPDAPTYRSDDEEIPWKSSDEDDDDEVNVSEHEDDDDDERTDSDNDGDEFVHLKFTTHYDEARTEAEVNEEDSFDPRVRTPSCAESTNDKDNDDETQGANVEGKEMDEDATNIEGEGNELYRDVNVNLEGRDAEITDAHQTIA
ncbi:copia protein [Tanacetum coccineum]